MENSRQDLGSLGRRPRVAIVVSHPIQHFCPLYRALSEDGRLEIRIAFASTAGVEDYYDPDFNRPVRWQKDILDGFDHEFLPGATEVRQLNIQISNSHLPSWLGRWRPDVVQVYGFHHGISRQAISWALSERRRVLYVSDSELRTRRTLLSRARKRVSLPIMFGAVDGFLTVGDCNEAYYRSYGVNQDRLFRCPFTIDESRLEIAIRDEMSRSSLRSELGVEQGRVLAIVVGKLTRRKCPEHVVEAVSILKRRRSPAFDKIAVLFAGDGPELERLRAMVKAQGLEKVLLPGFIEVGDLPRYYAAADLLIHPSSEDPHPLATSEAVFCGLPVVVSDRVGSVGPSDDVRPEENAIEYRFGALGALADAFERVALDEKLRSRMAVASRKVGQVRRSAVSVEGYVRAVRTAMGAERRRPTRSALLFQVLR